MTYLIEYLGEFEFIFETVLGCVSGDQMGYFEYKKTESKISRLGTFNVSTYQTRYLFILVYFLSPFYTNFKKDILYICRVSEAIPRY